MSYEEVIKVWEEAMDKLLSGEESTYNNSLRKDLWYALQNLGMAKAHEVEDETEENRS